MNLVFDIGGTNLRLARAGASGPEDAHTVPTPKNPEEALATLTTLAKKLLHGEPLETIAGGIAGIIDSDGTVIDSPNLPLWNGFPFAVELSEALGAKVLARNDALLAALGEAVFGAGKAVRVVGYLTISTGVGGARIEDKRLDAQAPTFEPGRMILNVERGETFEEIVSGGALERQFHMHPKDIPRAEYDARTPLLAIGCRDAILRWSPETLILGGPMINDENGYRLANVEEALKRLPNPLPELPPLRHAALGEESGLYGAYALLQTA